MSKSVTQDAINRLDIELSESNGEVRTVRQELNDFIQSTDEWREVERLRQELATAKLRLKVELESSGTYTKMKETLAELNFKRKDLREILSHHLIELKVTEQVDAVPTAPGLEKPIVLAAKYGKEQPATIPMFTGNGEQVQVEADVPILEARVLDAKGEVIGKVGKVELTSAPSKRKAVKVKQPK